MFKAVQLVIRVKSRVHGVASSGFVNAFSTAPNSQFQRLAGKVAVITGAASGIGKAAAAEFIRNGAKVIIADVQDDLGHSVAAERAGRGRAGRGSILCTASVMGLLTFGGPALAYAISKAAVIAAVRAAVLEAEDVARAALYLASDEAKSVTGHNLLVDGGFPAHKSVSMPSLAR